eukprot:7456763-Alexandrium_andersonii.AAC.1
MCIRDSYENWDHYQAPDSRGSGARAGWSGHHDQWGNAPTQWSPDHGYPWHAAGGWGHGPTVETWWAGQPAPQ